MTNDPVVRWCAGSILVLTYLAALLVVTHGYLFIDGYQPPPLIVSILSTGIGGALALLGVHLGSNNTTTAMTTTAGVVNTAVGAQNGKEIH